MSEPTWIVSQIGAREHYAVPRSLKHQGRLHTLYTDIWADHFRSVLQRGPAALRSIANRYHSDLEGTRVVAFNLWNALAEPVLLRARARRNLYEGYILNGQRFARAVRESLRKEKVLPSQAAFFSYNTGCLETLPWLNDRGVTTVVGQIDPARVEQEIVKEEIRRWPGWNDGEAVTYDPYFDRIAAEWEAATVVLVNSEWSREALVKQGVPSGKIVCVPLAYEAPAFLPAPTAPRNGPLRVLWLGQVVLRKGIQYLLQAANELPRDDFEFTVAGEIFISEKARASAPPNMKFVGRLTREQTSSAYQNADVFVLPTLSDGFAITQLEAMAHGVPVIATRNCGNVVTDGQDGLIVEAGDVQSLVKALIWCQDHRERLFEMGLHTRQKLTAYTLDAYADALSQVYHRLAFSN